MLLFLFLISIPLCFYTLFVFLFFGRLWFLLTFRSVYIFPLCHTFFFCVHFLFYFRSAIIFSISFHPSTFLLLLLSLFSFIFVVAVFITPLVSWECLLLQLRASTIVNRFSWNSLLLKTFSSPYLLRCVIRNAVLIIIDSAENSFKVCCEIVCWEVCCWEVVWMEVYCWEIVRWEIVCWEVVRLEVYCWEIVSWEVRGCCWKIVM